jgi:ATP-dependent helicase/nuclease subunit B
LAHELLAGFHASIMAEGRRWRDLSPDEARERFDVLAARTATFGEGIFMATAESRWQVEALVRNLREVVALLVAWARQSEFDPALAEVAFETQRPSALPAWTIPLASGQVVRVRGKVDRVDLCRRNKGSPLFLVMDYKLRMPRLDDTLMTAGIDLQLAAYALALSEVPDWAGSPRPVPAGMFYIGLQAQPERIRNRAQLLAGENARASLHVHRGRFRESAVDLLDRGARLQPSGQYAFRLNKDGRVRRGGEGRSDVEMDQFLGQVRDTIQRLGEAFTGGDIAISPFRKGAVTACDHCGLQSICRFDAWSQSYRRLEENAGSRDPS